MSIMSETERKRLRTNIKSKYDQRAKPTNASDMDDAKKSPHRNCLSENHLRKRSLSWNKNDPPEFLIHAIY